MDLIKFETVWYGKYLDFSFGLSLWHICYLIQTTNTEYLVGTRKNHVLGMKIKRVLQSLVKGKSDL